MKRIGKELAIYDRFIAQFLDYLAPWVKVKISCMIFVRIDSQKLELVIKF
jgi:hypothetical protein